MKCWNCEVHQRMSKALLRCQWNDMKESTHDWLNEPMKPWTDEPTMNWLVVSTPPKNISQLGWLFPIYGKCSKPPIRWTNESVYHWIKNSLNQWIDEPMKQWINEWVNQRSSGSMISWIKKSLTDWLTDWLNAWMTLHDCINECMYEWMNEWMNEWVNEWMSEWVSEWMNEWTNDWINEWTNEPVKKWMDGWIDGYLNGLFAEGLLLSCSYFWHKCSYHLLSPKFFNIPNCKSGSRYCPVRFFPTSSSKSDPGALPIVPCAFYIRAPDVAAL